MSEPAKAESDGTRSEEVQPESVDVNDTELENVSGGGPGGNMEVQQDGGGRGATRLMK